MSNQHGIKVEKIARIWETEAGFIVADYDNNLVTNTVFVSDSEAAQFAKDNSFEEVIWME